MQILIVVLLAIIAIAVAPWAVGIIALALGTYITAVTIVSVLAAALLVVVLSWRGLSAYRSKAEEKQRNERILEDLAIRDQGARQKADIRDKEIALESERKEQARIRRFVPCPHCSSRIAKGSMYCPACGKPPVSA